MRPHWRTGNRVTLLENGDAFFPRVFAAIENARRELLLETFIVCDDDVGRALLRVLIAAARRGVRVEVTLDGFGSADLPEAFIAELRAAGVCVHLFDPRPRRFGLRTNPLYRLHRKVVVVDCKFAFVGGINFACDHVVASHPAAKHDFAVEVEGPVVEDIHAFATAQVLSAHEGGSAPGAADGAVVAARTPTDAGGQALFVTRDNEHRRKDIERQYLLGIRTARHSLYLLNAYFFPSHRVLRALVGAARRGVAVHLILQGPHDVWAARLAPRLLHGLLRGAGVHIHECQRPLHGKVAVADDQWATVGSSNLDPFSLALNCEANLFVRDRRFGQHLRARLQAFMAHHTCRLAPAHASRRSHLRRWLGMLVMALLCRFPIFTDRLPPRRPRLLCLPPLLGDGVEVATANAVRRTS